MLLRPIRPGAAQELSDGFAKLSAHSRRMRFFTTRQVYRPQELRHLVECDGVRVLTLVGVFLNVDGSEREAVAAAHFFREDPASDSADVAIAVLDDYSRLGIGSALMHALAECALAVGIVRLTGLCHPENLAVQRLLQGMGRYRVIGVKDATLEFSVQLENVAY